MRSPLSGAAARPPGTTVGRSYSAGVDAIGRRAMLAAGAVGLLGLTGCAAASLPRRHATYGPDDAGPTGPGGTPVPTPSATAPSPTSATAPSPTQSAAPTFDRSAHSIDDPTSLWLVVNKRRPLPDYVPSVVDVPVPHTNAPQLRAEASRAVVALFAAAKADGLELASNSAYRSFTTQRSVYEGNVQRLGRTVADHLTAHPGCSEHQTGLAIDIGALSGRCSLDVCMGDEPEGRWLAANAWRHGFLLRYPADKVAVTGYQYEPWHFRFLGRPLARELHDTGVRTLEEFFGLPAAPDYP